MADIEKIKNRPLENFRALPNISLQAGMKGMTVSAMLERMDPTEDWTGEDKKMDAFERSLAAQGIRTRSNEAVGLYADRFAKFYESPEARAAGAEYVGRVWRRAKFGKDSSTRFLLTSAIQTATAGSRPYIEAATIDAERDALALPLQSLIAIENRINANSYRAVLLDESNSMFSGSRANEGAELPRSKLVLSDRETFLQKYGNAVEWTYEAINQEPIEVVGFFIRQLAIQAEYDKLDDVIDTLVNDPLVVVDNLQDLDAAGAFPGATTTGTRGILTMRALMKENMKFRRGPQMNTLLAQDDTVLDFLMTKVGDTTRTLAETQSTPLGAIQRLGGTNPNGFSYAGTAGAPVSKVIFLDRNAAIERISRIGGEVSETQRFITSQTEVMTMTEYETFHVVRPSAVRIVNLLHT